jgi:hypothetical protein
MKKYSLYTILLCLLMSLCCSCTDDSITAPVPPASGESDQGIFLGSPPEFEISVTRALEQTLIKDTITEQGVSVKITERPWIGTSLDGETEIGTRSSTWDGVIWENDYSEIGVFTVESENVEAYLADRTTASFNIKSFPFSRKMDDGTYGGGYVAPSGNAHAANPYNYSNANILVDARTTTKSTEFFDNTDGKEVNFYGYFPYQHQTAGIRFGVQATSICRIFRADMHEDNLLAMPYTFAVAQTKDNIRHHDVMYSKSEDAIDADITADSRLDEPHDRNRYGNRYKKRHDPGVSPSIRNDNVHMRFVHSFCRLRIKVSPGKYNSESEDPIELSELYITGEKVFVDGYLNLIEGIVSPGTASTIHRTLDNGQEEKVGEKTYVDLREKNLDISMIVQPTGEIQTLRDFKIVCVIDGVDYAYTFTQGMELKQNHVYDINLVLDPDTKILVSSGGGSTIAGYKADAFDGDTGEQLSPASYIINRLEDDRAFSSAGWMVVRPNSGWRLFKILEDGEPISLTDTRLKPLPGSDGLYMAIESDEDKVKKYNVICIPYGQSGEEWYADPDALSMHLDGKLNTGFRREDVPNFKNELVTKWKDISYNGNDGFLYNVETAATAYTPNDGVIDIALGERGGWDGKGLRLDGKDDKVAFPGTINKTADGYTVSLYICIEKAQPTSLYRWIISSGDDTTTGFPGLVLDNTTSTRLRIFGHSKDVLWGGEDDPYGSGKVPGDHIVQVDYTYKSGSAKLYIDGELITTRPENTNFKSVPWTALGGKLTDISRQAHVTYYNVMIYNKALSQSEIDHNFALNKERYGERKTENPESRIYVSNSAGSTVSTYKASEFNGTGTPPPSASSHTINGFQENKLLTSVKWMVVKPDTNWTIFKILEDGVALDLGTDPRISTLPGGELCMSIDATTRNYSVICRPSTWYVDPDALSMHLDGKLNDGLRDESVSNFRNKLTTIWKDISYSGNDGTLRSFATAEYVPNDGVDVAVGARSGWDRKGLFFDGTNDKVDIPGVINTSEYTVSLYVCLEQNQQAGNYAWIVSSGDNTSAGFPGLVMNKQMSPYRLRVHGHGLDQQWVGNNNTAVLDDDAAYQSTGTKTMGKDIVQIDYTYSSGVATLYVDGVHRANKALSGVAKSIATTLGGRTNNSIDRQVHMTLYNVMIYNKALNPGEILQNYNVNKSRYGTAKTD